MAGLKEKAREIGQALGRTDEYKALKRALEAADDDRELVELRNEVQKLESEIQSKLQAGQQPDEEKVSEYEEVVSRLQGNPKYQKVVAAQSNFDKVVNKVNENIAKGMQEGGESQIIMPS